MLVLPSRATQFRMALFVTTAALASLPMVVAYPLIGIDFIYFLPRLADTFLYQQHNGASIQWWTPTFGGGLPVFPNPQDLQLSLPQLFTLAMDPFSAICATLALVTLVSCYALHRLARGPLAWEEAPACLLAVAASTGGFLTMRMAVGQASYHAFALTPVLLLLAVDREIPRRVAIPVAGLVGAYFIYSGGYFVIFAAVLVLATALPVVLLLAPRARELLQAIAVLAAGGAVGLAISAAKLLAVFSWMRLFPRMQATEPLPSVLSPLLQLLGTPVVTLMGVGGLPSELHRALFDQRWGPWETDASLTAPVALAAFVAIPILLVHLARRGTARERALASLALASGVLVLVLTAGRGPLFALLKELPGVSNFRVNVRFAVALALPVSLVGIFALSRVAARWRWAAGRHNVLWFVVGFALLQQAGYLGVVGRYPADIGLEFDAGTFLEFCDRIRADPKSVRPIEYVDKVTDPEALMKSRSSLLVYEPLLGSFFRDYRFFARYTPLQEGPARWIQDGYFNMHFPPAFSYAESSGVPPYTRIPVAHRRNLEVFLERGVPSWRLPLRQRVANAASLVSMGASVIWLLALLHPRMRRPHDLAASDPEHREDGCEPDRRSV